MLPEEDCVYRVKVVKNCLNTVQALLGWHGVLPRLCSIGLAEQTLNAMAPHLALSTSWTLLLFLFTGRQRLLTVQAPVSWCVFTSVFHDLAEQMLNTRHRAIDRRLVVGSVFVCFVLHTCMCMILVRGGGGGVHGQGYVCRPGCLFDV